MIWCPILGVLYEPGHKERVFALKKAFDSARYEEGLMVNVGEYVQHKVKSDRQNLLSSGKLTF